MTLKKFRILKIAIAMLLSALVAQAVVIDNFYLALAAVLIAMGLILGLKRQVKEVMADERDYEIAGKAARYALTVFSIISSSAVLILTFFKEAHPIFETAGAILAYAVCFLLLLNSLIFSYLSKKV